MFYNERNGNELGKKSQQVSVLHPKISKMLTGWRQLTEIPIYLL